eukprot:5882433-Lingulodinium_polyedra.AAC.1
MEYRGPRELGVLARQPAGAVADGAVRLPPAAAAQHRGHRGPGWAAASAGGSSSTGNAPGWPRTWRRTQSEEG